MGDALQIRVSAVTWNEDLLEKKWPRLSELAWTVPLERSHKGVLEMVDALGNGLKFMDWSEARKKALAPDVEKALKIKKDLEGALADWDPKQANVLSNALEDTLDSLEAAFR